MAIETATYAEAFREIVESRRSVRRFLPEAVPEQVIRECIRLATLAPNSSNLQPWEFYWVRSAQKRAALPAICMDQEAAKTAAEYVAVVARTGTWRRHAEEVLARWPDPPAPKIVVYYYTRLCKIMYTQGPLGLVGLGKRVLAALIGLRKPMLREPVSRADMRLWAVKSTALAAENLMLAVRAHGYDSCPMEGYDSARLRRLLGLPRDATPIMVVAIGRAAPGGVYNSRFRFEQDRVLREV